MVPPRVSRIQLTPDLSISRVLTGLWQIADMERDGTQVDASKAADAMAPYVEAGLTTFDMADHYGSAEKIVGVYRRKNPDSKVELFTKWVPKPGYLERKEVRAAVQRSLDRMQSDRLDLLQYHAWAYAHPSWIDQLFWLQEMKEEGLIRHLGVTNFDTAHLRMALESGVELVTNQVCFSAIDQRPLRGMTDLCTAYGVHLLVYGTLAGGFLTDRWLGKEESDWAQNGTWSQMKYGRFIGAAGGWQAYQVVLEALNDVARKHRVTLANTAVRYILEQPGVGGVIVGARLGASEHIEENKAVFSFHLVEEDHQRIQEAIDQLDDIPGDCGDEYRRPPFLTASGDLSHHLDQMPPAFDAQPVRSQRTRVLSGTSWERIASFCRAVRDGNRIVVSGTTATHGDRVVGGRDPAAQTHAVIDKLEGAIESLGGTLNDVIRTRIYIQRMEDWEAVARVHGERFRNVMPANTLVQAGIIGDEYLVEIEAEAVVRESRSASQSD